MWSWLILETWSHPVVTLLDRLEAASRTPKGDLLEAVTKHTPHSQERLRETLIQVAFSMCPDC